MPWGHSATTNPPCPPRLSSCGNSFIASKEALMSSELVSIRRHGDVLDVVLDRPDNGNRLNAAMSTAIIDAVSHLDDTVKLVRLRSSGADFCTGRESPMPAADSRPSAETLRRIVAAPPLEL